MPVVFDLASELTNNATFGKNTTKATLVWSDNNRWAAGLLPVQTEVITPRLPLDADRAIRF